MNKEEVHDELIAPLLTQIIDICDEHKIAFLCDFHIPTEDNDRLSSVSSRLSDEYTPTQRQRYAYHILGTNGGTLELLEQCIGQHLLEQASKN